VTRGNDENEIAVFLKGDFLRSNFHQDGGCDLYQLFGSNEAANCQRDYSGRTQLLSAINCYDPSTLGLIGEDSFPFCSSRDAVSGLPAHGSLLTEKQRRTITKFRQTLQKYEGNLDSVSFTERVRSIRVEVTVKGSTCVDAVNRIIADFVPSSYDEFAERFLLLRRTTVVEILRGYLHLFSDPILGAFNCVENGHILPARVKIHAQDCLLLLHNAWISFTPQHLPSALGRHVRSSLARSGKIALWERPLTVEEREVQNRLLDMNMVLFSGHCAVLARKQNVRLQLALQQLGTTIDVKNVGKSAAALLCSAFIDIIGENLGVHEDILPMDMLNSTALMRLFGDAADNNGYSLVQPRSIGPHYYSGNGNKSLREFVAKFISWAWTPVKGCLRALALPSYLSAVRYMIPVHKQAEQLELIRNHAETYMRGVNCLPVFRYRGTEHLLRRSPLCLQVIDSGPVAPESYETELLRWCQKPLMCSKSTAEIVAEVMRVTLPLDLVRRFAVVENKAALARALKLAVHHQIPLKWNELACRPWIGFTDCIRQTVACNTVQFGSWKRSILAHDMNADSDVLRQQVADEILLQIERRLPAIDTCVDDIEQMYRNVDDRSDDNRKAAVETVEDAGAGAGQPDERQQDIQSTIQRPRVGEIPKESGEESTDEVRKRSRHAEQPARTKRYRLNAAAISLIHAPPQRAAAGQERDQHITPTPARCRSAATVPAQPSLTATQALRAFLSAHESNENVDQSSSEESQPSREDEESDRDMDDWEGIDGDMGIVFDDRDRTCRACEQPIRARELCTTHYNQWYRNNNTRRRK